MAYDNCTENNEKTQKLYVVLNDGSLAEVPDGVKPEDTLRLENRKLASREAKAKNPARRRHRPGVSRKPSKRTNYAANVVSRNKAILETVKRTNEPKQDPSLDESIITIRHGDFTAYMSREDWSISYA